MRRRLWAGAAALALLPAPALLVVRTAASSAPLSATQAAARLAAPVVLTGAQLPGWSGPAAQGLAQPLTNTDPRRSAHYGTLAAPPGTGVDPDRIAAFRWSAATSSWTEVRVQVDQRFPYFLANGRSSFGTYSGTDEELSYAWAPDAHSVGDETWKNVYGECAARKATSAAEAQTMIGKGVDLGPQETAESLLTSMQDPVRTLDDDDELVVMARDAGDAAPGGTAPPTGTDAAGGGQTIRIVDPLDPAASRFVYLFQRPGGSTFAATEGYVQMTRAADADEWIDRNSFPVGSTEALGLSNTGYGPNVQGTVCRTAQPNPGKLSTPDGTPRASTDRFPRDATTISTPTYRTTTSGRWMVRGHQVTRPGEQFAYGPDLIDRWKGRAFQQSPDSTVSLVGFEDEQVNWEANAALLGWRQGPVRAIREVWGADSGTNVTKTEIYYRDADVFNYHVRVHPIPPDGLYTDWDYNPGAVTTYYNLARPGGVPIDGRNDDMGNVDTAPNGQPAFFDSCDPSFDACSAVDRPEEVAGPNGGLVYTFEFTTPTAAAGNVAAVPYYRDDGCLDDGTGDVPVPRPWPGEASTDNRVKQGYVDYWKAHGAPETLTYADLACNPAADPATTPPWKRLPFQGAFAQHGIHFFVTQDSDNAFGPKPVDEIDGQQWRFSVPMSTATNVATEYGNNVTAKLQAFTAPYGQTPASASPSPSASPSASSSTSASASPTTSASPSASASASPSAGSSPSAGASPSAGSSPSASAGPSATATSSPTAGAPSGPSTGPSPSPPSSPSQSGSPSSGPGPDSPRPSGSPTGCPAGGDGLAVRANTATVNATGLASVTVSGAPPGAAVELQGYSQNHEGSMTFDRDPTPVDRRGTAGDDGAVTFNDLRPASNTRLRARVAGCSFAPGAPTTVVDVRATETLRVTRQGPGAYVFSGGSIPARPGGLVVSLYRVVGEPCAAGVRPRDCPGEVFLTQGRAQPIGAPAAGAYRIPVTFREPDLNERVSVVVKTGQDAQNVPGRSNVRSVLVY